MSRRVCTFFLHISISVRSTPEHILQLCPAFVGCAPPLCAPPLVIASEAAGGATKYPKHSEVVNNLGAHPT